MLFRKFVNFLVNSLLIFTWISSSAQIKTTKSSPFSSNILNFKKPTNSVSFSGFYRFLGFVRNQEETFPNNSGKTTVISSGDNYREPMFLLKLNGRTKENITFGADFMINSLYKGPSEDYINTLTLNLGLNLMTTFATDYGTFKLKSGGISWYKQSRLTVWGNRSFNRISLFERRPQTPLNKFPNNRYSKYYNSGLIDQGIRYGSRAFQGLFIQGVKLPLNFSVKGVLGKSNFNRSFLESSDNFTACFQLKNTLNKSTKISYNYLSSWADTDSLSYDRRNYFIHSLDIDKKINKLQFQIELGIGNYTDPEKKLGFGEAIVLDVKTVNTSKIPLNIQLYRISPQFVNVTGNFLNTTVLEVFPNVAGVGTTVRTPYQSPMVGLGFPVNNRQGASINADLEVRKFRFNAGIGVFAEIDTSYASLSYIHNVNSQTLSRIFLFGQNWGPYNSLNSTYRRVFENVNISDTSNTGLANFKKFFNTFEFQAKYTNQVFGMNYYIFSLTRLNTCQKDLIFIPKFGERTLISQLSEEIDFSIELSKKAVFILSYGIEKVLGNSSTDIGDNPEASVQNKFFENLGLEKLYRYTNSRNQTNTLLGFGIDYKINDNVFLFLRSTQYRYFDPNFIENHLKGFETMLELKINF